MSDTKNPCEHPEKLKGKPGDCSPEQIKECHGEEKSHSCCGHKAEEKAEEKAKA